MIDKFETTTPGLDSPIGSASAVTPDDSADLAVASRALYVGGAGDLHVTLVSGDDITLTAAIQGWHPVRAARVWATGTTATDIVAGW